MKNDFNESTMWAYENFIIKGPCPLYKSLNGKSNIREWIKDVDNNTLEKISRAYEKMCKLIMNDDVYDILINPSNENIDFDFQDAIFTFTEIEMRRRPNAKVITERATIRGAFAVAKLCWIEYDRRLDLTSQFMGYDYVPESWDLKKFTEKII